MLLLLLMLLLNLLKIYTYDIHCSPSCVTHGILSASDARAAASFIPAPSFIDVAAMQQSANRMRTVINDFLAASQEVRPLVIFHYGNAMIVVEQVNLEGIREQLPPAQAAFLWRIANEVALDIIRDCVVLSRGEMGGRAQFPVIAQGNPTRSFALEVKEKEINSSLPSAGGLVYWKNDAMVEIP